MGFGSELARDKSEDSFRQNIELRHYFCLFHHQKKWFCHFLCSSVTIQSLLNQVCLFRISKRKKKLATLLEGIFFCDWFPSSAYLYEVLQVILASYMGVLPVGEWFGLGMAD